MNYRDSVRYNSKCLPDSMGKVTVSWDEISTEADVLNHSAHGMRIFIPFSSTPYETPLKNSIIMVSMPIEQKCFAGMCVSATTEHDGSVSMGVYFYNPDDQNYLQALLCKYLKAHHQPGSYVSYEWEETIEKIM